MAPLLDVDSLAVTLPSPRGPLPILHDVSLTVDEGELVGIAGESGCGKSLTAQTLLGLLPAGAVVSGSARYAGTELLGLDPRGWQRVRGAGIAMVFQDPSAALHPMLTVGRQLTEHMRVHLRMDRRAAGRRAVDLLDQVRIPDPERALRAYPHQFSGGMRQRVAIAIALAARPRLLIADEPTTALDVTVQAGILALLDRLRAETGLAVAFITHDLGVLSRPHHPWLHLLRRAGRRDRPDGRAADRTHPPVHGRVARRPTARHPDRRNVAAHPGRAARPGEAPPGCPFQPRCGYAEPSCGTAPPPLTPAGADRSVACVVRPQLEVAA